MKIDQEFDWKTYSWLKRGHRRAKVLEHLAGATGPVTATWVKRAQRIDITQSAFTLNELLKAGLAGCLNPEDHHGKLYTITEKGKQMLKKLDKQEASEQKTGV